MENDNWIFESKDIEGIWQIKTSEERNDKP
jgi:hypothetical protein